MRPMRFVRWLICFLILNCAGTVHALDPHRAITQYAIDTWTVDDGLVQGTIHTMVQTRDGFLWLGTQQGLMRFDGARFTLFDKRSNPEIESNWITQLLEDRDGDLWVGTWGGGLYRYDGGRFRHIPASAQNDSLYVSGMTQDRAGTLWVASTTGLGKVRDGRLEWEKDPEVSSHSVTVLATDSSGVLWIGTNLGLAKQSGGRYEHIRGFPDSNTVYSLLAQADGSLLVGTHLDLKLYYQNSITTVPLTESSADRPVDALLRDEAGNLWFGSEGGGLRRRTADGKIAELTQAAGLADTIVLSLLEDREGSLWVGTRNGLNRLKDGKVLVYGTPEGLSSDSVYTVLQSRDGKMWIGTNDRGLNVLSADGVQIYTADEGLSSNKVSALMQDRAGDMWIGTLGGGVNLLRNGKFQSITYKEGLAGNWIWSLLQDRHGTVWVGTYGHGLSRIADGKIVNYRTADGLPDNSIRCILEMKNGSLWFATERGLVLWDQGRFKVFTTKDGLSGDGISHLYEDAQGTLWIATFGWGIIRYRNGKFTPFRASDGIPDEAVALILEDDSGNLWLSSNTSICRVSKRELDLVAERKTDRIHPWIFGKVDGMRSPEGNGGYQPGGWKSADGHLWFPTQGGIVRIDPQHIPVNRQAPPVYVTQAVVDGRVLTNTVEEYGIVLQPGSEKFEFHYTALSYLGPSRMQFKFKLEGLDRDWVDAGTRRIAYYTNVPPGRYSFRVIASNNDGVWNETGASLRMRVLPYFYQTRWFAALCVAAGLMIGYGIHFLRLRQIRKRFGIVLAERSRIARELHDTVAQNVSALVVQLQAARETMTKSPETSEKFLAQAEELGRQSIGQTREAVLALRESGNAGADFISELECAVNGIVSGKQIASVFRVHGNSRRLSRKQRSHLLRICEEAVRNAVKHSGATRIETELMFTADGVQMRIRDNGCGFDAAQNPPGGHYGLLGIRERAEQISATCTITTSRGAGTEIVVGLPTDR